MYSWRAPELNNTFSVSYDPIEGNKIITDNKLIIDYNDIFNVKIYVEDDDRNCSFCIDYIKTKDVKLKQWNIDTTGRIIMIIEDFDMQLYNTIPFHPIPLIPNAYQELQSLLHNLLD